MGKEIKISTEKEFIEFLNNIDNEDFLRNSILKADRLSVSMKIEGENFDSSLTGSLIKALADYQNKIYHIYRTQKYGLSSNKQLTDEELRALEIKVEIKPGCTEAVIGFVKESTPKPAPVTDAATGCAFLTRDSGPYIFRSLKYGKGGLHPVLRDGEEAKRAGTHPSRAGMLAELSFHAKNRERRETAWN